MMKKVMWDTLLKQILNIQNICIKLCSDLPFLPERMNINGCKKLVCNLYDKKDYVDDIKSLSKH